MVEKCFDLGEFDELKVCRYVRKNRCSEVVFVVFM